MLRLLDTFSGIGGFSYAAERIVGGYETVAFVEREPFCQKVLRKHWPDVPIFDDITTYTPERGSADVICGGFPCQDISTAGRQAGIKEGTRSGLFYELMRVIRMVEPRFIILENVSAILANGLDTVLGELAEAGFDAEWACIPASAVGACHQRDRWWLVAYAKGSLREKQSSRLSFASEVGSGSQQQEGCILGSADSQTASNSHGTGLQGATGQRTQGTRLWRKSQRCLDPNWKGYISKPVLHRGDDGLSSRVDRIKALGNSVVPQVAAIPLARVLELATPSNGDDGPPLLLEMLQMESS